MKTINIIIAGEGGQGVQKIGEILAETAFNAGYKTTYIPNFTVQQRGGVSIAFVIISNEPIIYPKFTKASLAVILSGRSIEQIKNKLTTQTIIINNSSLSRATDYKYIECKKINSIKATELARDISPKSFNMIMLGKIIKEIKILDINDIKNEVTKIFKSKYTKLPNLEKENNKALELGASI
ncbi:MAG: 2-oxoacid:acceptor oxidoreductase family protein [Candidatus Falkowbacteria bacterium]|nr:2-oxoacid:acceptor oxidoreductase family protein [Candidatus Falkowbacteria bacterium]